MKELSKTKGGSDQQEIDISKCGKPVGEEKLEDRAGRGAAGRCRDREGGFCFCLFSKLVAITEVCVKAEWKHSTKDREEEFSSCSPTIFGEKMCRSLPSPASSP